MQHDDGNKLLKYLTDAYLAACDLMIFKDESLIQFSNWQTKWVVERGVLLIGEALKRSSVIEPNLKITDLHKIFATRNKIAHEYDEIEPSILFIIIKRDFPILIAELEMLLKSIDPDFDPKTISSA